MSVELTMLLYSALLTLLLPVVQATGALRVVPFSQLTGNREHFPELPGWVGRANRAHRNMLENLAPFAAIVLVAQFANVHNTITVLGAEIFFIARLVHAVVYLAGIPMIRTFAFLAGWVGTVMIASQLF
ncbi:MAG TPA: MAPEG family protein [Acidisphaera sp.]|nr:MAPEG family protein [Acidisphaera sp.]